MTLDELLDNYAEAVRYNERADDRLTASERNLAQMEVVVRRRAVVEYVASLKSLISEAYMWVREMPQPEDAKDAEEYNDVLRRLADKETQPTVISEKMTTIGGRIYVKPDSLLGEA